MCAWIITYLSIALHRHFLNFYGIIAEEEYNLKSKFISLVLKNVLHKKMRALILTFAF
jgi:hypothetical protein